MLQKFVQNYNEMCIAFKFEIVICHHQSFLSKKLQYDIPYTQKIYSKTLAYCFTFWGIKYSGSKLLELVE